MLESYNIVELLRLNLVKKGSTAKPTFPPPDFFWRLLFEKIQGSRLCIPVSFQTIISKKIWWWECGFGGRTFLN